jgi:hypothetical protein
VRWSRDREPWCSAIGRPSSFTFHSSWNISSAWLRVLTKTSVIVAFLMASINLRHSEAPGMAAPWNALI